VPDFDDIPKSRALEWRNASCGWLPNFLALYLVVCAFLPEVFAGRGRDPARPVRGPDGDITESTFDMPLHELAWNKSRLLLMDAYDRSGLHQLEVGKSIEALAARHGYLPDALHDICRMAYVRATLSAGVAAAEGDAHVAWESVEAVITSSLVREFLSNYPLPGPTFLKELSRIPWEDSATEALFSVRLLNQEGEGGAKLADARVRELLDPQRHPSFDLEPDWFLSRSDAWGVHHLQQLEKYREQITAGFTGNCQERMRRLLSSMQIPEWDIPLLMRRGLEHVQTRQTFNSLMEEFEPIWNMMGSRAETERLFHQARLNAFETYVEACWNACLGGAGSAMVQSLRDWDRVLGVVGTDSTGVLDPALNPGK
jgi:hypothetical protein